MIKTAIIAALLTIGLCIQVQGADQTTKTGINSGAPEHPPMMLAALSYAFSKKPPPIAEPVDKDDDGVTDDLDLCPQSPPGVTIDFAGCPVDEDSDGVANFIDQCPMTPTGIRVTPDGCPLDSDNDGVLEDADWCPDTSEGIMVDEKGCDLKYTLHIEFDFGTAEIQPQYHEQLREAAAFVESYPAPYVLIAGHTDSKGKMAYNRWLSLTRAQSVRQYLIDRFGVPAGKLVAQGMGESSPIVGNDTEEGRRQNRRVEVLCCTLLPPQN